MHFHPVTLLTLVLRGAKHQKRYFSCSRTIPELFFPFPVCLSLSLSFEFSFCSSQWPNLINWLMRSSSSSRKRENQNIYSIPETKEGRKVLEPRMRTLFLVLTSLLMTVVIGTCSFSLFLTLCRRMAQKRTKKGEEKNCSRTKKMLDEELSDFLNTFLEDSSGNRLLHLTRNKQTIIYIETLTKRVLSCEKYWLFSFFFVTIEFYKKRKRGKNSREGGKNNSDVNGTIIGVNVQLLSRKEIVKVSNGWQTFLFKFTATC